MQLGAAFYSLTLGAEGGFDSQRKVWFLFLLVHTREHTHTHGQQKKQAPHRWYEILIFILGIAFPSWASFLLSEGCFLHPYVDIQTQFHSWSGLDPRQVLYQALLDAICEELEGGSRKKKLRGGKKDLKKDSICHRTSSSWKWKKEVFFFFYGSHCNS